MLDYTTITYEIHPDRIRMGAAAARLFQQRVAETVRAKSRCRVIFGCAPSQDEFFQHLVAEARAAPDIWERVEAFHMDEYVGLPADHPQSFRFYLRRHFLDGVKIAGFHPIQGEASSARAEAKHYAALLAEAPIDVVGMGIGENGHVAFNDPSAADFQDPLLAKVVKLEAACRQQQVNDGCFPDLASVPRSAITVTIPVFARAGSLVCTVPGPRKAQAVRRALFDPIGPQCPATILRLHPRARLFLDPDAAALVPPDPRRLTVMA